MAARWIASLSLIAFAQCRPTAGYDTLPLGSISQFPPAPHSVEQGNDGTQVAPPPTGVPGVPRDDAGSLGVGRGSVLWPQR